MLVVCRANSGISLTQRFREESGNTSSSVFHITVGRKYGVYAMALWRFGMGFLLVDDIPRPHWYPAQLFEPLVDDIPPKWRFSNYSQKKDSVLALWGYPSIINEASHYDSLIDGKLSALKVFLGETMAAEGAERDGLAFARLRQLASQ
jgi:hypothetical protein